MSSLVDSRSLTGIFLSASETRFGALRDHEAGIPVAFSSQSPHLTLSDVVMDILTPARQTNTTEPTARRQSERLAFYQCPLFFTPRI